jgi:beta-glucosidase
MRQVFLYPFQQAIEVGHIGAVMPSYNENNGGIPSNSNPWLLRQILRKEFNFTGITVSDYFAVEQLATLQHVAADKQAAGILAFSSGVDMELPTPSGYPYLADAVKSGKVPEVLLDEAVARVLSLKFRTGLFDHPYTDADRLKENVGTPAHAALARKVADEAIILLKNQANLLPLDPAKIKTLAVIGPNADKVRLGDYSGTPSYFVTVVDGIRKRLGSSSKVVYAEGCRISEPDTSPMMNTMMPYGVPDEAKDGKMIQQAIETAQSADVVVLVLGGNESISRESFGDTGGMVPTSYGDSDTLELPGRQNELVTEILKLGKPVVAVLLNGKAYSINLLARSVPAILEGWYLGQETGNAVAGVLFGDVNPSGHLPVSIARNVGQLPVFYYKTPAARRGYVFDENTPLFPFGFGLSYTTFSYGKPTVSSPQIAAGDKTRVSVIVSNSGSRAGDDVVQMYIHHPTSSVVQPVIALRGFQRVHLEAGESKTVSFDVGPEQLSILNREMKAAVEAGPVDVMIGDSSASTNSLQLSVTP